MLFIQSTYSFKCWLQDAAVIAGSSSSGSSSNSAKVKETILFFLVGYFGFTFLVQYLYSAAYKTVSVNFLEVFCFYRSETFVEKCYFESCNSSFLIQTWVVEAKSLLEFICSKDDAHPFREPVDPDMFEVTLVFCTRDLPFCNCESPVW